MRHTLNVTKDERQRYSWRMLQAISALRAAELSLQPILEGKQWVDGQERKCYRLIIQDQIFPCANLKAVRWYANDYHLYWTTMVMLERDERISYERWRKDGTAYALAIMVVQLREAACQSPPAAPLPEPPAVSLAAPEPLPEPPAPAREEPARSLCSAPECAYPATGLLEGQPYCAGHAYVYAQMLQARARG